MKRTVTLLLAILLTATSFAQVKKAPAPKRLGWDRELALYGNVDSVVYTVHTLKDYFGEIVKDNLDAKSVYKFNERGDVVERSFYDFFMDDTWECTYKYDSAGNMTEIVGRNHEFKNILKYDSVGNLIENIQYRSEIMIPELLTEYKITYRK